MNKKRSISVLAICLAMGTALASTPTFAHKTASPDRKSYRTPKPKKTHATGVSTAVPAGANRHPVTGAGGTAPLAGVQPAVSGAGVHSNGTKPSTLPATGGAAQ